LSIEGGARVRYERVQAEAVYFHTLFDDMIVRVAAGEMSGSIPILTKENSGEGHMHGIELSASVKVHRDWALWGNWTWMRGELDREDYRIHGSGVNEAGGYFVMTARVQF
jgi:outer membrane receptor for ferrienterochelin and colicin